MMKNLTSKLTILAFMVLIQLTWTQEKSLHPLVELKSFNGTQAQNFDDISVSGSCNECHDVGFIATHNTHTEAKELKNSSGKMQCLTCHLPVPENFKVPKDLGEIQKELLLHHTIGKTSLSAEITPPSNQTCLMCHSDMKTTMDPTPLNLTQLNFKGKANSNYPADIHSGSGLNCIHCHSTSNHPSQATLPNKNSPAHLKLDPRASDLQAYLKRPNHNLNFTDAKQADCTQCHSTEHHSKFLPKTDRHLEKISCQACHIPSQLHTDAAGLTTKVKPKLIADSTTLGKLIPFIQKEDSLFRVNHGVVGAGQAIQSCTQCHSPNSRIESAPNLYVFGKDSVKLVDWVGIATILMIAFFASLHGGLRIIIALKHIKMPAKKLKKGKYIYSVYERLWHGIQAIVILLLLFTGIEIHLPQTISVFGFKNASLIHQAMGILLAFNAFLAFFYHLASGEIKQYLPEPKGFFGMAMKQQMYYLKGIFKDEPHPFDKDRERKLNPMQKIAYLILLNILLPLLVITGLLMAFPQSDIIETLGGLETIAGVHALGSWMMGAFLLMHVYLTTTGPKPLTLIKAMITGWEDEHEEEHK